MGSVVAGFEFGFAILEVFRQQRQVYQPLAANFGSRDRMGLNPAPYGIGGGAQISAKLLAREQRGQDRKVYCFNQLETRVIHDKLCFNAQHGMMKHFWDQAAMIAHPVANISEHYTGNYYQVKAESDLFDLEGLQVGRIVFNA